MKSLTLLLTLVLMVSCNKKTLADVSADVEEISLNFDEIDPKSLVATPSEVNIAVGESLSISLTGIFPYRKIAILTKHIEWSSADSSILSIDAQGKIKALKPGKTVIGIKYRELGHTIPVQVGEAVPMQIIILPATTVVDLPSIHANLQPKEFSLETYALLTDGRLKAIDQDVTWESSDAEAVEWKSASTFIARKSGNFELTARFSHLQSRYRITVTSLPKAVETLELTSVHTIVRYGDRFHLPVKALMNNTEVVTDLTGAIITPSDSALQVSGTEIYAGIIGKHSLNVQYGGKQITVPLTIEEADVTSITIDPSAFPLALGQKRSFTATASFSNGATLDISSALESSIANGAIATVANREITAVSQGSTLLTVSYRGFTKSALVNVGNSVLSHLDIRPSEFTLPAGESDNFQVMGVYTDGQELDLTNLVTSRGLAPSKADVTSPGVLVAKVQGSTKLSATYIDPATSVNLSASATVTIQPAYLQSIVFDPASSSKALGRFEDFRVKGRYSDNSEIDITAVVRISADVSSAGLTHCAGIALTGSNRIRVTGLNLGSQKIIASYEGHTGEALFTATAKELDRVDIVRLDTNVATGQIDKHLTARFMAQGTFSDLSTEDITQSGGGRTVTWNAPDPTYATLVDDSGEKLFTALQEGNASFTISVDDAIGTKSNAFSMNIYIPCPSPGLRRDYFCWYLGAIGDSCTTTCSNAGSRGYHSATLSFAGSSGSDDSCRDLIQETFDDQLDATFNGAASAPAALGCSVYVESPALSIGVREEVQATNAGDSNPLFRRVCSCE